MWGYRLVVTTSLSLAILVAPLAAEAQQAGKIPRIGYLGGGDSPLHDEFRRTLRDLGYTERQNIVVEYRWYEGRLDTAREQAAELVRLGVDVLVATGPQGFVAVKEATAPTNKTPIVMAGVSDPVGSGFVSSLARPGGHITGLSWDVDPELMSGKLLQLLKEAVPKAARVAVLWNPDNRSLASYLKALENAAGSIGTKLQPVEVRQSDDLRSAFSRMVEAKVDALVVFADPMTVPNRKRIASLAAADGRRRRDASEGAPHRADDVHDSGGGLTHRRGLCGWPARARSRRREERRLRVPLGRGQARTLRGDGRRPRAAEGGRDRRLLPGAGPGGQASNEDDPDRHGQRNGSRGSGARRQFGPPRGQRHWAVPAAHTRNPRQAGPAPQGGAAQGLSSGGAPKPPPARGAGGIRGRWQGPRAAGAVW